MTTLVIILLIIIFHTEEWASKWKLQCFDY